MYYLKYRPKTLSELDNSAVRERITKILSSQTLPHAFLFTGPKGTGKTSTARIIAKVLNAEENKEKIVTINPAETDTQVRAITQGNSADVIEMDAASNRKIDDIRKLISELKFTPLSGKYKIYIIDEVHMLTKEAFNALLKSLEEPPVATIFILATTEEHMLPKTITSRCIRIPFTKATQKDVLTMLQRIVTSEDIEISQDSLKLIAQSADGSFRDAAKILELAVMQEDTSDKGIETLIGASLKSGELLLLISNKKTKEAIEWIEKKSNEGADMKDIIQSLLHTLHSVLLIKNGIEVEDVPDYNLTVKQILVLISHLQTALQELRYTPIEALPLEKAVVAYHTQ